MLLYRLAKLKKEGEVLSLQSIVKITMIGWDLGPNFMNGRARLTTYRQFKSWIPDSNPHDALTLNRWYKIWISLAT